MRAYHKIFLIILFFAYLVSSFEFVFAQNLDDFPAKSRQSQNMVGTKRDPATNLIAEREKLEIYSKLRDRRCTTMTIDKCDCPDAKEMRAYVDALLEVGLNKEEVFYRVAKKFSLNTIMDKQIKTEVQKRLIKEAGKERPQIILEPTRFNFGRVSKKQGKLKKIFEIHNRGTAKLIINNLRVSCECVTVSLKAGKDKSPYFGVAGAKPGWQLVVEPKKSGELEVVLDLSHSSVSKGKVIRDIFVASNDPLYPESAIRIEAEVED